MHVIAQNAAEGIISSLIPGFALAAIAWSFVRVLPPGKASLRFGVWFSALVGIALLPLVQVFLRATSENAYSAATGHGLIVLPQYSAAFLLKAWAAIACLGLMRVAAALWHLHRVRSASFPVAQTVLSSEAREAILRATRKRAFELRVSDQMRVPVAIGFVRPAIIIPKYLLDELSPAQLSQVLLHEAAHLLRYDDWTNLLQKITRALLFFHPAAWWLENKLSLEREMACDEAVIAETCDPRSYAECLTLLAEKSLLRRSLALVQAAVSRMHHTSLRVRELLAPGPGKTRRSWAAAAGTLGVLACSAMLVEVPDLVSFQGSTASNAENKPVATAGPSISHGTLTKVAVRPPVLPAALKHKGRQLSRYSAGEKTPGPVASRTVVAQSHMPVQSEPQLVLATNVTEQPVPMLITTTMIVESNSDSNTLEQVWGMWRVIVYYPTPESKARGVPHSI